MTFIDISLLEIYLQCFHSLTSDDFKWPLASMQNDVDHVLNKRVYSCLIWDPPWLHILRYCVDKIFTFWPLVTPHDFLPHSIMIGIIYSIGVPTGKVTLRLPTLGKHVYNFFTIWPLVTPNDFWTPPKPKGIIYSVRDIHGWSRRSLMLTHLEIKCLQVFHSLVSYDSKWPLTVTLPNKYGPSTE